MKRAYHLTSISLALLCSHVASATTNFIAPSKVSLTAVTWQDVTDYFATHAVSYDPTTEQALEFEAEFGIQTWTVVGTDASSIRPDGPAIGWPRVGMTIEFATPEEASEAAALILQVTYEIP